MKIEINLNETTLDGILNQKIKIAQPKKGYRVAIDPVFLGSAVNPKAEQSVLDVGAGVGAASLCLAYRVPNCTITALEIQPTYAQLALHNAQINHMSDRLQVIQANIKSLPAQLKPESFDHVMTNPPFFSKNTRAQSPVTAKAIANHEIETSLNEWIEFCTRMLKPNGTFTMIHIPDRLDEILELLNNIFLNIKIFPLFPKRDKPPNRFIIQANNFKNSSNEHSVLTRSNGLILHESDGRYTSEADDVLRHAHALDFFKN